MGVHVVWLCPISLEQVTAKLFGEDAQLTVLHQVTEVDAWLASRDAGDPVDAVVVDASPAAAFNYEPAVMTERLAARLRPRLLVVVVMRDLFLGRAAHDAMALELHEMWASPRPELAVEGAVYYYVRHASEKTEKDAGPGQRRMWEEIAARTGRFLAGTDRPDRFDCPDLTRVLVQGMTAGRGASVPIRFGRVLRRILVLLAYGRYDRAGLAERLSYSSRTVETDINRAVRQLRDLAIEVDSGFLFLSRLAERHAVWLRSLNERRQFVTPAELPTD